MMKRKKKQMMKKKRQQERQKKLQKKKKAFARKARSRATLGRARLLQFSQQWGGVLPGLTVYGKFDEAAYDAANPDVADSGLSGFEHFKEVGFWQGYLVPVKTRVGLFVGAWDAAAYLGKNGLDLPDPNRPPFHPDVASFRHFKQEGFEAGADVAISNCVAKYLLAKFRPGRYGNLHKQARAMARRPRPGKPNMKKYAAEHPEAAEDEDGPLHYFAFHGIKEGHEVWVKGRCGKFNKKFYKRRYGKKKPAKHYKRQGHKQKLNIKVKAPAMGPAGHYVHFGYEAGLAVPTGIPKLAAFRGVFSPECYAEHFEVEDGWEAWKEDPEQRMALTRVQLVGAAGLRTECWPPGADEEEEEEEEEDQDIEFSDDEEGGDGDEDDEDDDDDDEGDDDDDGDEDDDEED